MYGVVLWPGGCVYTVSSGGGYVGKALIPREECHGIHHESDRDLDLGLRIGGYAMTQHLFGKLVIGHWSLHPQDDHDASRDE